MNTKARKRATVADVAERAGVSVATVDRVLNRRRRVKAKTEAAVLAAARELNLRSALPAVSERAVSSPARNLGFILQKRSKYFYQSLASKLREEAEKHAYVAAQPIIRFVDELSPIATISEIRKLSTLVDALAVVALNHPYIVDEIRQQRRSGLPIYALLSGISSTEIAGFIGIDARKAGRTAGWALERCAKSPGPIGILIGNNRYTGHEDREGGLRSYWRENGLDQVLLQSESYQDDNEGAYNGVISLKKRHPDMAGLYLIGGGSEGAIHAFNELQMGDSTALICQDLTDVTKSALLEGTVDLIIDTPINQMASSAIEMMGLPSEHQSRGNRVHIVAFGLYTPENV